MRKILFFSVLLFAILIGSLIFLGKWPKIFQKREAPSRKLIIGTEPYYFPMEFLDEKGELQGFDIDLAKELAGYLGVEVEFKILDWENLFLALEREEVDMVIASVTITPERMNLYTFSDPYFNAGQVVVVRKDTSFKSLQELQGKVLGAQKETTSEIEAKKITLPELVVSFENNEIAQKALVDGKIEGLVIDLPAAQGMVSRNENLKILTPPFTQEFYGIVFKKDNTELAEKVNLALAKMKYEGKLEEIRRKWFGNL